MKKNNIMAVNLENYEDEEPKLKYDRMGNDVENILLKDAVSCICVHTKFFCLGTQWGVIHLLDHEGNTVPISQDGKDKELQAHAIAVNKISVDVNGEYIASCSDDGKVVVYGLYSNDNTHNLNLGRVVKSVAIDPFYFKNGTGRRFLTGTTCLNFSSMHRDPHISVLTNMMSEIYLYYSFEHSNAEQYLFLNFR